MKFEVLGPYEVPIKSILKIDHVSDLRKSIQEDAQCSDLLSSCGCYVFGVKSSGAKTVMPWYVGKAERQTVLNEATNPTHLQLFNEILDEYKRGTPTWFFLPALTPEGRARKPTTGKGGIKEIDFLEDWLIAQALKRNPNLWNIRKTKMLRDLTVRGLFNPKQGDMNDEAAALKACLGV